MIVRYAPYTVRYLFQNMQGCSVSSNGIGLPTKAEQRHGQNWVQTERAGHEAIARLIGQSPMAARLIEVLIANMGEGNAVVASQTTLGELLGRGVNKDGKPVHRNSVRKAIKTLEAEQFIEVVQVGGKGGALAYVINSRVAWHGKRDGIRYARFSAEVLASETEQSNIDDQPPLRRIPQLMHGEQPIPSGPGEPPPSQPGFDGMEPIIERGENEKTVRDELERRGQQRINYKDT